MIGSRFAHYEIVGHLGTGGMGEVYQATDSKLRRSVAIKFLPEAFNHDSDRLARFEREARVLASLNHPNIAAIHGLEESDGRKFLVMELVSGETLAERIKRSSIPLSEALEIATQVTHALEAAHEKNVVHRDLKPANVKITAEGVVKVLDFGLAKAYAADPAAVSLSDSPTLSALATQQGVIMGTAAYMSPEQAKGKEVDRRTDIFAFGAVLYELLSGRPAFEGDGVQDILGSVLKSEPDWTRLPPDVPASIHKLLRVCLQKDLKKRRQTATDVRFDIEEALKEPPQISPSTNETGRFEVVVQSFPELTVKMSVSTDGGAQPRWRADNKELYFIALDGKVMSVSIDTSGGTLQRGKPVALFPTRIVGTTAGVRPQYAVANGRFLINETSEGTTASPIVIISNWKPKS